MWHVNLRLQWGFGDVIFRSHVKSLRPWWGGQRACDGLSPLNGESVKWGIQTRRPSRARPESNTCAQCQPRLAHEMPRGSCCAGRVDDFCETRKTKASDCPCNAWCEGSIQCICPACSPRFAEWCRIHYWAWCLMAPLPPRRWHSQYHLLASCIFKWEAGTPW